LALTIRSETIKTDSRQSYRAVIVLIIAVFIIVYLYGFNREASLTSLFGFLFGYILQRSRFCFAAGFRDIFMVRNTAVSRAILLLLLLTSIGFFVVHSIQGGLPGNGIIYPLGLHTLVGGLLFGFGMVIAGNCVTGGLMRMGEGYLMQWFTFIGLLIGSALGAWNLQFWGPLSIESAPVIFIPDALGWPVTIALYFILIALLYLLALWYERGTLKSLTAISMSRLSVKSGLKSLRRMIFSSESWPYTLGAAALALTNTLLFAFWGHPAGITSGLTHLSGWLACRSGLTPCDWYYFEKLIYLESRRIYLEHPLLYLSAAIVAGSLFASLLHREFRLRRPKSLKFISSALVGGTLLGYSSRVAMGCNFGGFWSGAASFSLHSWVFGFFILIGAYLGGKFFMKYLV
jgi:uncharacterized protein